MKSGSMNFGLVVASLALCMSVTQVASAQRRGGRGFFVVTTCAIGCGRKSPGGSEADGRAKSRREGDLGQAVGRATRSHAGGDEKVASLAMREKMTKMNSEATEKLVAKLDDTQKKRLTEIYVQQNGASALMDPAVAKTLEITEEQTKALEAAVAENRQAMMESFRNLRDSSQDERMEAMTKLRSEGDERLLKVLTDEQKAAFGKMKGEELEIDRSELLRGFGRGRGNRGGGGNRPE